MNAERVKIIAEMVENYLSKHDVLVSTKKLLNDIVLILQTEDNEFIEDHSPAAPKVDSIVMSCDASIKENPGGPAAVGIVIQNPRWPEPLQIKKGTKATTNNQAEYDAIYTGLVSFINLNNNPGMPIVIRSDSQLIIKQLKKEIQCQDKQLVKRRDLILELVDQLPVPVTFEWRPRNSTTELELANHLAQDLLGVPRH